MHILVVDDHPDTADALQMLLRSAGHSVRVAYDGTGALAEATEHPPEIAFIDLELPDMSGYAVAKALRKQLGTRVSIVGITGGGGAKKLPFSGIFDQHAIKPITAAQLYQLIDVAHRALQST
jgi:two-component system, sensor histidine kinase